MEAHRWAHPQWWPSIGSTQTAVLADPVPGRVVVADHQSAGQGRRGRGWTAPPDTALAISVAVPAPAPEVLGWVPLLTGLAVVRALRASRYAVPAQLKWPNDVLVPDPGAQGQGCAEGEGEGWGKVCGVLAHVVPAPAPATAPAPADRTGHSGAVVVVGAGLNIDQTRAQLPVASATSWRLARGGAVLPDGTRQAWVADYLASLADLLDELRAGPAAVRTAYLARCRTLGSQVRVELPDGRRVEGVATDVEASGALRVRGAHGATVHHAGDVVHVRPPLA